jgi:hypothetical protein
MLEVHACSSKCGLSLGIEDSDGEGGAGGRHSVIRHDYSYYMLTYRDIMQLHAPSGSSESSTQVRIPFATIPRKAARILNIAPRSAETTRNEVPQNYGGSH